MHPDDDTSTTATLPPPAVGAPAATSWPDAPPPSRPPVPPTTRPAHRPPGRVGRTLLLLFGGLVTVAAIGWAALGLVGVLAHATETTDVRFSAAGGGPVRRVVADVGNGSITVIGDDRSEVSGRREVSRGLQAPTVSERVEGDALFIDAGCSALNDVWCGVAYTLHVPAGASVEVSSDAGRIDVTGTDGNVWVRASAGGVDLADLSGPVDVESDAGGIVGRDLRSDQVRALSHAGEVDLTFLDAPTAVDASSKAGGVEVVVPADGSTYAVDADSAVGGVDVGVPTDRTSPRRIVAASKAGGVTVRTP